MSHVGRNLGATFVPGADDDYYMPPPTPELVSPEPQRVNPEMSNQIAGGIESMDLNAQHNRGSLGQAQRTHQYSDVPMRGDGPHLSPIPRLVNPPPNVPPSDEELEATLENARSVVLNSNDPEMQLAWAADALVYVGVCADNEERTAAAKPMSARPATPRIEHQLKTDAMNITSFLAEQHHPKAEFLKGMWLEWGRFGQREDKKEAFRCYSRAADRGYTRAEYRIGMLYESYNDPVKALRHYHRGVDAGDAASCYRLGMMTLRGQHGQPQDYNEALSLIRRSAETADENAAQGAYVYGMLLARQLPQITLPDGFLPQDDRLARLNIEKAAYLKFAKAQLKMGSAYELGSLGCEFNPALSVHYNALAAKQGEAEADMALSKWFLVGSEGLFPKNEELAYTYAERAAQSGLATAEFALGYFNEIGVYVPVSLDQAMGWYQKASKHGNQDANGRIESLERKQVLSKKDHENVAISRIKSQHGSMRGGRPERFQQRPGPTGLQNTTIAEHNNGTGAPAVFPPARGTTPYPESDGPPLVPPLNPRSGSAVPYPQSPAMGGGHGPVLNQQYQAHGPPPDARPSSAFQLNPALRSSSTSNVPQASYPGRQPYDNGALPPGGRPMTTQAYNGAPTPLRQHANQAAPIHASPPVQGYPPQAGGPPAGPQRPPMPSHQATAPAAPGQQRLDIGFTAPADDRRNRTYGPGRPMQDAMPPPQPQTRSPALRPSDSMPNFGQGGHGPAGPTGRVPTPTAPPGPRVESRRPVAATSTPKPPPAANGNMPTPVATPKPNTRTSSAPSKPQGPGKGPKTFDEMGVPSGKQTDNCAIM